MKKSIPFGSDTVEISTKKSALMEKYKIDPKKVKVRSAEPIKLSPQEKFEFLEKLLEAHELAKINVKSGNIVKLGFATNMRLKDNSWHLATNFNNTRNDISNLCGERSAMILAYNDMLKGAMRGKREVSQSDFKITHLVMSSAKPLGEDKNASAPCADCLSWLNTSRYLEDDTKIVFLTKEKGQFILEFKTLKELLPQRGIDFEDSISSDGKIPKGYKISSNAFEVIKDNGITIEEINQTVKGAKARFEQNEMANYSNQNIGACVYANGEYFSAAKIDWSKRWFVEPVEFAMAKAIEKFGENVQPKIIAYWGDNGTIAEGGELNDGVVSLKTLGRIKTFDKKASPLVVTISPNNTVEVQSISDFLPENLAYKQNYLK